MDGAILVVAGDGQGRLPQKTAGAHLAGAGRWCVPVDRGVFYEQVRRRGGRYPELLELVELEVRELLKLVPVFLGTRSRWCG